MRKIAQIFVAFSEKLNFTYTLSTMNLNCKTRFLTNKKKKDFNFQNKKKYVKNAFYSGRP